jgi:hypothetical protein
VLDQHDECSQAEYSCTEGGTSSWAPRSDPSKRFQQLDHVAGNRRALECTEDVHLDWLATRQALGEAVDHAAIVVSRIISSASCNSSLLVCHH